MLFSVKTEVPTLATETLASQTADTGKIRLGGASRLPVKTADTGKIRLGGASRLPVPAKRA